MPAPQLVDRCIQSCPIDTRRALYGNIVLSVSLSKLHTSTGSYGMPLGTSKAPLEMCLFISHACPFPIFRG